jgi:hypothetical protein
MAIADTKTEQGIFYYFECTKYNIVTGLYDKLDTGDALKELNENVKFEKTIIKCLTNKKYFDRMIK